MINITVIKKKHNIKSIQATGHSGYAEQGGDIVCSAVSVLMETLANGLTEIVKAEVKVVVDEEIPHLMLELIEQDAEKFKYAQMLMKTTLLGLKGVEGEYGKYIKIKEKQND